MKIHNNVKYDVNVKIKNKKLNPLHDWLHGVDFSICTKIKRSSILKFQLNIASKSATVMHINTMTKDYI